MKKIKNKTKLTDEQMTIGLKNAGHHLANLIFIAPLTQQDKIVLADAVPHLTIEQIEKLTKILETGVELSSGDLKKDELMTRLANALDDYNDKKQKIEDKTKKEMQAIEEELNKLEAN
jgi:hypothetical protein